MSTRVYTDTRGRNWFRDEVRDGTVYTFFEDEEKLYASYSVDRKILLNRNGTCWVEAREKDKEWADNAQEALEILRFRFAYFAKRKSSFQNLPTGMILDGVFVPGVNIDGNDEYVTSPGFKNSRTNCPHTYEDVQRCLWQRTGPNELRWCIAGNWNRHKIDEVNSTLKRDADAARAALPPWEPET